MTIQQVYVKVRSLCKNFNLQFSSYSRLLCVIQISASFILHEWVHVLRSMNVEVCACVHGFGARV